MRTSIFLIIILTNNKENWTKLTFMITYNVLCLINKKKHVLFPSNETYNLFIKQCFLQIRRKTQVPTISPIIIFYYRGTTQDHIETLTMVLLHIPCSTTAHWIPAYSSPIALPTMCAIGITIRFCLATLDRTCPWFRYYSSSFSFGHT